MLRYLTAGESHGIGLTGILEGMPAGLLIDVDFINNELYRRQQGYGRGGRMKIESDKVNILSGVRFGKTTGAPITLQIMNKDWENWTKRMSIEEVSENDMPDKISIPRPGHADLAGSVKFNEKDIRNIIERASARETAIRTALGAISKLFLREFEIEIGSHVLEIHNVTSRHIFNVENIVGENKIADNSPVRCLDQKSEKKMMKIIDKAKKNGDTVGGRIEIIAHKMPIGLGSHVHWDKKLDGRISAGIMSIPAIKAVEIGMGIETGRKFGSEVHDPIIKSKEDNTITRRSNNAGGLEGGITNGQPLVIKMTMKPISSLINGLDSIDLADNTEVKARFERSDTCAVPAAGIVGEAVLALILNGAFLEKFSGDNMEDVKINYNNCRR